MMGGGGCPPPPLNFMAIMCKDIWLPLASSALIHLLALALLPAVPTRTHEAPVIYVSSWPDKTIAGKNAGPKTGRTLRSAAEQPAKAVSPSGRYFSDKGERLALNEAGGGRREAVLRDDAAREMSLPAEKPVEQGEPENRGGSGRELNSSVAPPTGPEEAVKAFSEHAARQVRVWRYQFMMNVEAQMRSIKTRNYFRSAANSLERALSASVGAGRVARLHGLMSQVDISLAEDGTLREVSVAGDDESELASVLLEKIDWAAFPLPSRFGLAERGVRLKISINESGKIRVTPELLNHLP